MTTSERFLVVVVVVALAVGPVAGSAGAAPAGTADAGVTPGQTGDGVSTSNGTGAVATGNGTDAGANGTCAATPPENSSDPPTDVLGWENGTWYDEPLAVDQSDGANESELDAILARTMARIEYVRCLEFEEQVQTTVIDRETYVEQQLNRTVPPALRAFDNAKFEALFLINESADSIAVQNANRGTAVLGYYDPRNDTIVLVSGAGGEPQVDEMTLAHELVHALQDARYDLTAAPLDDRTRDGANAVAGLVEGDARYTQTLYERLCADGAWAGTCLREMRSGGGDLANRGVYFVKYQPYSDGPTFVRQVREAGGWQAVNDLYDDPPASAEQVIDPSKYEDDPPTNVSLADRTSGEWQRVRPPGRPDYATLGQSALMATFVYPLYHSGGQVRIVEPSAWLNRNETGNVSEFDPLDYDHPYVAGWDGDRLHVYANEEGELAYVWRLAWDSPGEAREFLEGYRQVLRYWGGERVGPDTWRIPSGGFADAFHVSVDDSTVTVVNAPTVEGLSEVRTSVDPGGTGGNDTVGDGALGNGTTGNGTDGNATGG